MQCIAQPCSDSVLTVKKHNSFTGGYVSEKLGKGKVNVDLYSAYT